MQESKYAAIKEEVLRIIGDRDEMTREQRSDLVSTMKYHLGVPGIIWSPEDYAGRVYEGAPAPEHVIVAHAYDLHATNGDLTEEDWATVYFWVDEVEWRMRRGVAIGE